MDAEKAPFPASWMQKSRAANGGEPSTIRPFGPKWCAVQSRPAMPRRLPTWVARRTAGSGPAGGSRHGLQFGRFGRPNCRNRRGGRGSASTQAPASAPSGPACPPRPQPGRAAQQPPQAVPGRGHPLRQTRRFLRRIRPTTRHYPLAELRIRPGANQEGGWQNPR